MLQWLDDFTSYGTDAGRVARLLNGAYAEATRTDLVADPDPTAGGQFVLKKFGGGLGGDLRKILSAAQTTVGVAARYWLTFIPTIPGITGCPSFCAFKDVNNYNHLRIEPNPSGYIDVWRVDVAGDVLIATSASPVIVANAWQHVEVKAVIDAVAGSVEVRVEGSTVINVAGIRTTGSYGAPAASCSQVAIQSELDGAGPVLYVKDFIIWDGTGAANHNFFGTCQVYKIVPDSDVSLGWTPSAGGTGYNLIDETTPTDDAGYISAPFPLPAASTFTLTDLPANVTVVKGVMAVTRSRKTDGGDGNLEVSILSGASVGAGANRPMTVAYTYWDDLFDLDPQGGGAWTKARVDALELKLDRTV